MTILAYFTVAISTLLALAQMILTIGKALADCPDSGRAARAGAITIATGFTAIGTGAVILIAAGLAMTRAHPADMLLAMGLACLILGLGFTHAVTTLRSVVQLAKGSAAPVAAA